MSNRLRSALAVTSEICGIAWTQAACQIVEAKLSRMPEAQVLAALDRCQNEVKGRLSLADIIERLDDGRPGADEAWAQVGTSNEDLTLIATNEALEAWGEVRDLLKTDEVGARMAFREAYKRIVQRNKMDGIEPTWTVSMGKDPAQRKTAIGDAAKRGYLTEKKAALLLGLPPPAPEDETKKDQKMLPARSADSYHEEGRERVAQLIAESSKRLAADRQIQRDRTPKYDWKAEEERLNAS